MDKTKAFLITVLVILLFGIPVTIGKSQDHILVIHSASPDSNRASEIQRGMEMYRKNFPEFANTILVENYYLDMDKPVRQKCEIYLTEIQNTKKIIEDKKPDLVVLSGDMAQRLIGVRLVTPQSSNRNYLKNNANWLAENGNCADERDIKDRLAREITPIVLDYKLKIVFMSVTIEDVKVYGYYENENMAGIYERLYVPAVKEVFQDLYDAVSEERYGKPANIVVVGDSSDAATQSAQLLKAELSRRDAFDVPLKWGGIKEGPAWEKWRQIILDANEKNSMIFVAGYNDLISDELSGEDIVKWTEACAKFPALGGTESFIADGGMLSVTVSNQEQGAAALNFARQLLDKERPPENVPFKQSEQFIIGMNKSLLEKRQIILPVIYESFSRETDNYENFGDVYPADCE